MSCPFQAYDLDIRIFSNYTAITRCLRPAFRSCDGNPWANKPQLWSSISSEFLSRVSSGMPCESLWVQSWRRCTVCFDICFSYSCGFVRLIHISKMLMNCWWISHPLQEQQTAVDCFDCSWSPTIASGHSPVQLANKILAPVAQQQSLPDSQQGRFSSSLQIYTSKSSIPKWKNKLETIQTAWMEDSASIPPWNCQKGSRALKAQKHVSTFPDLPNRPCDWHKTSVVHVASKWWSGEKTIRIYICKYIYTYNLCII